MQSVNRHVPPTQAAASVPNRKVPDGEYRPPQGVSPIIWRGVKINKEGRSTSRMMPGIGLVPPALYIAESLQEALAIEKRYLAGHEKYKNHLQGRIGIKNEAVWHALANPSNSQFTSWSRSWTYALSRSLQWSRLDRPNEPLETLSEELHLVALVPDLVEHERIMDLATLLKDPSVKNYYNNLTVKVPPPRAGQFPVALPQKLANNQNEQEVVVFGHVPANAFFTVSLHQLLTNNGILQLHDFFVRCKQAIPPTVDSPAHADLRQLLSEVMLHHQLCFPYDIGRRWMAAASKEIGRFHIEQRMHRELNETEKQQDALINWLLQRATREFAANGASEGRTKVLGPPRPGEICW